MRHCGVFFFLWICRYGHIDCRLDVCLGTMQRERMRATNRCYKKTAAANCGLKPRLKLWLSSDRDEGVFGDGKWRLLGEIERTGNLRAAAAELRMSYRKAWGDIRKAESCLGRKLVTRSRGGVSGGHMTLTAGAKKLMAAYAKFRGDVVFAVTTSFNGFQKELE